MRYFPGMLLVFLLGCLAVSPGSQQAAEDWVDPSDMLGYDHGSKTMRKPAEPAIFTNVVTKRREYNQNLNQNQNQNQAELSSCQQQLELLQNQVEEQRKRLTLISQQPSCSPVFRRFLGRLLKEAERLGTVGWGRRCHGGLNQPEPACLCPQPADSSDVFYDAKVKLTQQTVAEIRSLLEGEDRWRTGALDDALSHILVDLKRHNYEAWKWRFEDAFGVELDTVLKIMMLLLVVSAAVCTQAWSAVSWLVQFKRMFAVSFVISIIWNWFYLYQTAFAKHQNDIVKMENFNEKCTGVKKIDWRDNLKEWFRTTWTLQDDPCKKYYEVLMVNPLLLVPPTKAISVTMTTFITEPLKHIGAGISEFLRELLRDLPVTLQIPVLLTIVLSVLVVMYGGVQAAFQHGIAAPFRRHRNPPLPEPKPPPPRVQGQEDPAGGDAPAVHQQPLPWRGDVVRRRPGRGGGGAVLVETLMPAAAPGEDEPDAPEGGGDQRLGGHQPQGPEVGGGGGSADNQQQTPPSSSPAKMKQMGTEEGRPDEAGERAQTDAQDAVAMAADAPPPTSLGAVETAGVPVQETSPAAD